MISCEPVAGSMVHWLIYKVHTRLTYKWVNGFLA